MSKKIKYTDDGGEMDGAWRVVEKGEFPGLDALVAKLQAKQKVTLELDHEAIVFFKREAGKRKTSYQRMIRNLVLSYARAHAR